MYEELDEKVFARGDSSEAGVTDEMQKFLGNLKKVRLPLSRSSCVYRELHGVVAIL